MRPKTLHPMACGCVHNSIFWVELCTEHRRAVRAARNRWDAYCARLVSEKKLNEARNFNEVN